MSVVWSNNKGWILSHSLFLHNLYSSVCPSLPCGSCGKYLIFHIDHQFLRKNQKKMTVSSKIINVNECSNDERSEVICLQKCFMEFMQEAERYSKSIQGICSLSNPNNQLAVDAAGKVLRATAFTKIPDNFHGGNINSYSIIVDIKNEKYVIPPRCSFYSCDVMKFKEKLIAVNSSRFDLILMDPPWRNKHVRRKNVHSPREGYDLMSEVDLVRLPIDDLLSSDGLVAVWCTNSQKQVNYLLEKIFPTWNVRYVATWYWIKVNNKGEPTCNFSEVYGQKQPFERIIFACRVDRLIKYRNPDSNKLLISIPSSIHSHKPPLVEVLRDYIHPNAKCLELFARYLIPGWISCGNEVLKLQNVSMYE